MSDVYVYYFMTNESNGELSQLPATLEAIGSLGRPLLQSQIAVDHTQLDEKGFVVARAGAESHEISEITTQIWSLEVRAASRDREASASADGVEKYMLRLESRELRKQARQLSSRRIGDDTPDSEGFIHFGAGLAID